MPVTKVVRASPDVSGIATGADCLNRVDLLIPFAASGSNAHQEDKNDQQGRHIATARIDTWMLRQSGFQGGGPCGRGQAGSGAALRVQAFSIDGSRTMLLPWQWPLRC